ncbi:MAG: energy transducer TonB [Deltaproteobacteria bacterium]|nr:energy transducer TonB [Deltaproteobacteria bacterium]
MTAAHVPFRLEWLVPIPALVALGGLAAVAPVSEHLRGARAVVGAVAALVVIGLPATAYFVMGNQLAALEQVVMGGEMVYAMADRVGELPRTQHSDGSAIDTQWPPLGTCLVEEGTKGWRIVRREHGPTSCPATPAPASFPLGPGAEPLVVVKPETPAKKLAEAPWFTTPGVIFVLTQAPTPWEPVRSIDRPELLDRMALGTLEVVWSPLEEALADTDATWVVLESSSGILAGPAEALAPVQGGVSVASSLAALPGPIQQVVLIPGPRWTVQDVLSLCAAVHDDAKRHCVLASGVEWEQRMARLHPPPPRRVRSVVTGQTPVEFEPAEVREGGFLGIRSEGALDIDGTLRTESDAALSRDEIEAVIKRHRTHIRYCYQQQLATEPRLAGKLTVRFVIAGDGTVSSASIVSSTLNHAEVESCVTKKAMRMEFPAPKGGEVVKVNYPFIFSQE